MKVVPELLRVRPLTHCNREGVLYTRLEAVERQIEAALTLDLSQLLERVQVRDYQSPDFLQEECLVYLLREYRRMNNTSVVNVLAEALLRRCASFINENLQALGSEIVDDAYQDVVQELFEQILDIESDRGDFLQVRFWFVVKRIVITTFGRYCKYQQKAENTVPLSSLAGYEQNAKDSDIRTSVSLEDIVQTSITMEQRVLYQEGLRMLEEPHRIAFVLRYYYGWPIEHRDPSTPSICRYFNKTSRTIRLWLSQVEKILEQWRGEKHE